ncbi:MAG: LysR substrate-binding domain-containing protein [Marinovum algicola]|nr:LysR substrate-binding domain-containing protein [Marinovum algicola]
MINIRQLECLRAVMMSGNMTQAAESLGIAQPSASSLIANLEHALGFKLFERVKGRLVATPEAKVLMPDVQRTLESVELTEHRARQIRDNRRGDLVVVSYPDIAIDFLPEALSDFLADRPSVRVHLQARRSEMMTGLLQTHDFDLAISTRLAEARNLDVREFAVPCMIAFPRGQAPPGRLALEPIDLQSQPLISVSAGHPSAIQLSERFDQRGVGYPGTAVETQTFESVCGFVRRGFGAGLIDAITASRYREELDIVGFVPTVWQTIYLLRPLDRPASKIAREFSDMLAARIEALVSEGMSAPEG